MNFLERVDELMRLGWSEADACRTATEENLMKEYMDACDEIAEQCREEGYPDHGSNYDLRTEQLWNGYFQPQFDALEGGQPPAEITLIDSINSGNTEVYTDQAIPDR